MSQHDNISKDDAAIKDHINLISNTEGSLYDSCYLPGNGDDTDVMFVCFSGGGIAGMAFAGVLQELEARGLYQPQRGDIQERKPPNIRYWLGSSAGAICASLAALGMPSQYIIDEIIETDFKKFFDIGGRTSNGSWWSRLQEYRYGFSELLTRWGAARGDQFTEWFRQKMVDLGWNPQMTLMDLYHDTGQHLIVTTTSINTFETLYLSRSNYPNMQVADAVHASIIYPFVFQPIVMRDLAVPEGNRLLVDGGLLDNFPLNACDVSSATGEILGFNRKAIGFILMNNGQWMPNYVEITSLLNYATTFMQSMHKRITVMQSQQPYFWERVVPIETYGVSGTDFNIDRDKLKMLIASGRKATQTYLDQRNAMLQTYGPLPKNLFIPNPRLLSNGIEYISDDLIDHTRIYQTNPSLR